MSHHSTDPLHVVHRLSYGPSPSLVAEVTAIGPGIWIDQQLNPAAVDDHVCDGYLTRYPRLKWTIPQVRAAYAAGGGWEMMEMLGSAHLLRAAWSKRQLFEVMVDFWSNHLNVSLNNGDVWDSRHDYDRNVIRKYTFGKYSDLLWASVNHPAMMRYLNNADSTKDSPNENYGRELLELHTVGVDGGYNEVDMHTSALVLTGFGVHDVWRPANQVQDPKNGLFEFFPDDHWTGPVTVMGWSSPNQTGVGGYAVAQSYVSYLAHHPATALRLATKLVRRFVSDDPIPILANYLAKIYLANDTAILPVLKALFASRQFRSPSTMKVKRPMEDLVSSLRALSILPDPGTGTDGLLALWWESDTLGHQPMTWAQPDGFPDVATSWQSTNGTLERWNLHMALAGQWWPVSNDPKNPMLQAPLLKTYLPSPLPATHGALIDALAQRVLFQPVSATGRDAICTFLGKTAASPLKAGDPAVSYKLAYVIALLLDSVHHAMR